MRFAPLLLACISLWGLYDPQNLLAADKGGGRWVFALVLLLSAAALWRSSCKRK